MKVNSNMVFHNLIWRFAERVGAKGVSLIISIVLARILTPEAYGTVALLSVFLTIFSVFVDSGLGNALIQKKDADADDFTTVFYFNLIWCALLYILLYAVSPMIAEFYGDPNLTALTRVTGLTILFSGVKNVQQAYVSRTMQFKKFFIATLGGTVFSGLVGLFMAYHGFEAWALVTQSVTNTAIDTIILWFSVKWRPNGKFNLKRLHVLYSYGWKLLASALLDRVYNNLRSLVIGKKYDSKDLAYYNKGKGWPDLIVENINSSIDSVLLPTMSSVQDDRMRVKQMTRRSISISTYVMAPMMLGLFCVAPELVSILLTDKWLFCVPYMRIFCVTNLFYPVHTANLNAIKAMGRSDWFLKLEIIKKVVGFAVLFLFMWHGPLILAYSLLLDDFCSLIINTSPNKKLLDYSFTEQMKDIMPSILLAIFMGACISFIPLLKIPSMIVLICQIAAGAVIYIGGSLLMKNENFIYLWKIVKPMMIKVIKR